MTHSKRRKVNETLTEIYYQNSLRAKSYSDFVHLEKSLQIVGDNLRKKVEEEVRELEWSNQLALF